MIGDYIIQTDHQAKEKTSKWWPAILHGTTYAIPFLFIVPSVPALLVIIGTHIIIDRFRLAKYLAWAKNQLAPKDFRPPRSAMLTTGYSEDTPIWLSTWLMIIADNTLHLIINTLAIVYLGHLGRFW